MPDTPPAQGVQAPIVLAAAVQEPVWDVPAGQAAGQAVQVKADHQLKELFAIMLCLHKLINNICSQSSK